MAAIAARLRRAWDLDDAQVAYILEGRYQDATDNPLCQFGFVGMVEQGGV